MEDTDPILCNEAKVIEEDIVPAITVNEAEVWMSNNKDIKYEKFWGKSNIPHLIIYQSDITKDEALLIQYYCNFRYTSFIKLREMAKANIIPRRLANTPIPICSACICGTMVRRSKRNKGDLPNDYQNI